MRITVIGSTGHTGRHVLIEALRRDHQVVAFTRRPAALSDPTELQAVVEGDGRDPEKVREAVAGSDAVISIINGGSRHDPHRAADATRTITTVMADLNVRRLVITSPYPLVAHKPRIPLWVLRRLLATPYADAAEMERVVSAGDLDWTIARLTRLTDKPATGAVLTSRVLLERPHAITRADVAATLLDIVQDTHLAGAAVNVCGR